MVACQNKDTKNQLIQFNNDSTRIVVLVENKAAYYSMVQIQAEGGSLADLISVVQLVDESDSSSIEKEVTGTIFLKNNRVEFLPNSPFLIGRSYYVTTAVGSGFGGTNDMIRSSLNARGTNNYNTLKR